MALDQPVEEETQAPAANTPDDVWRAGADPIEAEDLTAGFEDIIEADPMAQAMEDRVTDEEEEQPGEAQAATEEPEVQEEPEVTPDEPAEAASEPEADDAPVEAAAEEAEPEPEDKPKTHMVPKSRMDQEAARRRAAESRLNELQQQLDSPQAAAEAQRTFEDMDIDFGDDAKQMFDRALDGDIDTANELFTSMIRKVATTTANSTAQAVRNEFDNTLVQNEQANSEAGVIEVLESSYDVFNPGSEAFSQDAVAETIAMQNGFISQGYTRADAMQTAANYYLKMHDIPIAGDTPPTAPEETAAEATPAPAPAPKRAKEDVERNVEAAQAQPPTVDTGRAEPQGAPALDIARMSEEEIYALPESTLKRLRGDYV